MDADARQLLAVGWWVLAASIPLSLAVGWWFGRRMTRGFEGLAGAARRVAAVTFSGTWGADRFDAIARELLGKLAAAGQAPGGPPVYARYDPPWTPWFLRKNEVLVPLADAASAPAAR